MATQNRYFHQIALVLSLLLMAIVSSAVTLFLVKEHNLSFDKADPTPTSRVNWQTAISICREEIRLNYLGQELTRSQFDSHSSSYFQDSSKYQIYIDLDYLNNKNQRQSALILCEVDYAEGDITRFLIQGEQQPETYFHTIVRSFRQLRNKF